MEPKTVEFLQQLLDISRIMAESRDLDSLLDYALEAALDLVHAQHGHLILLKEDGTLHFRVSVGTADDISHTILNRVLATQQPLLIDDAVGHTEYGKITSVLNLALRSIMCVPLISRDQLLGGVYVENRTIANMFQPHHLEVLIFFAKQAGVLIENAMLATHLQKAHEALVTVRAEERRRIRRDLHDGLGPSLAALRMELAAARNLSSSNIAASSELIEEMKGEVDNILVDIRRIVYELRPPALDELGLISAIEEYIATCERNNELAFNLSVPDHLPPLPAAIEVAIYRIIMEAITNVIRHANADHCLVRLSIDRAVLLEIHDNGQGLPEKLHAGVGLSSMRERIAELGGIFHINSHKGTHIKVELPFSIE